MSAIIARQLLPADFVKFDAFDQHSWTVPKSITRHPVLPAPEVSDHVQVQNGILTFRGYIGTPGGPVPSVTAARVRAFFDLIGGALCVVTTPFGVYSNCVVQGREVETIGGMVVDVKVEQVRIASIAEVPIPPRTPSPTAAAQLASSQDAGSAAASSASAGAGAGGSALTVAADGATELANLLLGGG